MLVLEQFTFLIVNVFSKKSFFCLMLLLVFQSACISKNIAESNVFSFNQ